MFRIPTFYQFETSFDDAVKVMTIYGKGDLLAGMEGLDDAWKSHCQENSLFEDDDDFYEFYEAEVNAYNVIFSKMQPLMEEA